MKLINYKKSSNMNIEFTYIDITKKSRKIAKLQLDMKTIALLARRFQTLLHSLLDEYNTIRDVIDAQINSNIDASIQKLQKKKVQIMIKNKKIIILTKNDRREKRHRDHDHQRLDAYRISQRRSFNNFDERRLTRNIKSKFKNKSCFLCDDDHQIKDCDLLRKLKKLRKFVIEKTRKNNKFDKQKQKTYNVNDNTSFVSNSVESLNIDFDNEKNMKKIVALFKKLINIILKFD